MNKIKLGIAGLGRSGWGIHATAVQQLPELFEVAAAMDLDEKRRQDAAQTFGAQTYDDFSQLVNDPNVEAVVVATPNFLHTANAIEALEAGKHVICEKPFGLSSADADQMIAAAKKADKFVVPFQNRRFEPHFQKVKKIIESGILGEIVLIRIAWHSFSRRWDWQTLREFGGGQLLNTGPHMVDHGLQLLGGADDEMPEIYADLRNVLSSGDAEDHAKIVLRGSSGPTVDLELSTACAFAQDRWLVMGKNGGLRGTPSHLEWKWVDWSQMPERPVDRVPTEGRSYNREELNWQTDSCDCQDSFEDTTGHFYRQFFAALREGASLPITPQSVRKQIAVIEKAKELTGF